MAITVRCHDCGQEYRLKDAAAGKTLNCKDCGTAIRVPAKKADPVEDDFLAVLDSGTEGDAVVESDLPLPPTLRAKAKPRSTATKTGGKSSVGTAVKIGAGLIGFVVAFAIAFNVVRGLGKLGGGFANLGGGGEWIEFTPPDSSFRIQMPSPPKTKTQFQGSVMVNEYACESRQFACSVAYSKIGAELSQPGVADLVLNNVGGELERTRPGSRIVNQTPITFRNFPGRQIELEINDLHNSMRFYLCGDSLFALEFITKKTSPRPADQQKFFDSFDPAAGRAAGAAPSGGGSASPVAADSSQPYLQRKAAFQTKLLKQGPAPQDWQPESPPTGVEQVRFSSGALQLKAWVGKPNATGGAKSPAFVFFHGGFAFGGDDFSACDPFRQAGFVVMAPMLRGENGQPGNFELFWHEIDDAKAAVRWVAAQPYVDGDRVYAFGHSVGGGISCLLSLHDDVPLRHCGSSGGLYPEATFVGWSDIVPFDQSNPVERKLRILLGNIKDMQRQHHAYIGDADELRLAVNLAKAEARADSLLTVESIAGDHFTSFKPALRKYLQVCQSDTGTPSRPAPRIPMAANGTPSGAASTSASPSVANTNPTDGSDSNVAEQHEATAVANPKVAAWFYKEAAVAWLKNGNSARAQDAARKAEAAGPESRSNLLAHFWHRAMGDVYLQVGQPKLAVPHYEQAIKKTDIEGYIKETQRSLDDAKSKSGA
jgi:DNA-directed RNA polymerase subunit RPC12/RpoP